MIGLPLVRSAAAGVAPLGFDIASTGETISPWSRKVLGDVDRGVEQAARVVAQVDECPQLLRRDLRRRSSIARFRVRRLAG